MQTTPQRDTDLLARSAFALVLLGALISLIVGIALLRAPMRPTVRVPLLLGYGVFFLLVLGSLVALLVAPMQRINATTRAITRLFGHPALAVVLALLIVVVLALAIPLINGVVSNLSSLTLLLLGWGGIGLAVLALSNAGALGAWLARTRGLWQGIGVALALGLVVAVIFVGVGTLLNNSGLLDRLRGSSDYRDLIFYGDDVNPERSRAYWTELGQLRPTWVSYTYTRMGQFSGDYINIDSAGRRATASFADSAGSAPDVYFFGGSTMWGEGSRDGYTIPSQVSRLLNESGTPIRAINYGQVAYVSTQDEILFERQLATGNIPAAAVFYGGFNDLGSVYISNNAAGLPQNEVNRQRDLVSGQVLRDGRPLLSQPNYNLSDLDLSLVSIPNASPAQIVDLYLANLRLIRAAAGEFGVKTMFVWQPAILYKQTLDPREQAFVEQNRAEWPGFDEMYRAVDEELRRRVEADGITDILVLSDLFADESRYLFYDRVHVIEDGNTLIAQAIAPALANLLADAP